jgi:hypothetical protein
VFVVLARAMSQEGLTLRDLLAWLRKRGLLLMAPLLRPLSNALPRCPPMAPCFLGKIFMRQAE